MTLDLFWLLHYDDVFFCFTLHVQQCDFHFHAPATFEAEWQRGAPEGLAIFGT